MRQLKYTKNKKTRWIFSTRCEPLITIIMELLYYILKNCNSYCNQNTKSTCNNNFILENFSPVFLHIVWELLWLLGPLHRQPLAPAIFKQYFSNVESFFLPSPRSRIFSYCIQFSSTGLSLTNYCFCFSNCLERNYRRRRVIQLSTTSLFLTNYCFCFSNCLEGN